LEKDGNSGWGMGKNLVHTHSFSVNFSCHSQAYSSGLLLSKFILEDAFIIPNFLFEAILKIKRIQVLIA
jgi:hypothetical protein